MTARRGRLLAVVTAVAAAVLVAAVVVDDGDDRPAGPTAAPVAATTTPATGGPVVIVPGRPGEAAVTRPAGEARADAPPRHNTLDTWYVRMMIPHHEQALEMAQLAAGRAADPRISALADRIRASQAPEIGVLRAWLTERGLSAEVAGHDHRAMRGMQSPEAMSRLAAARGVEFDRMFVRMMTDHHRGAVQMSVDLLGVGADQRLQEFANSVATEQNVEIDRMRDLLPA
ncbi:Uncharacterized conserved protein, DUF305 family [Micromonospora nigra]|uniref:Uncharacterized conserved protein, DUF305 family n=1 Tax=Micromonospora nigra TaxID=145857 RepID=A0A1C6T164_9ACTN|nr:DUF305 domain-containing protein [Micromonospora nigra]SCL35461.1 Uncharacterized conserved protein, DUF305 family [Micromonospora nigra]